MNATNDSEVDSFHSGGSQFCFANGNLALVNRSGGEKISANPFSIPSPALLSSPSRARRVSHFRSAFSEQY